MCLLAFSWNNHPRYRFVFAGNRDEFHARPAAAADWWPESPDVIGGRDLEAGGSWLGVHRDGRFAVVTNFREPDIRPAGKRSRGELVSRFLEETHSPARYLVELESSADEYAGFNLLFGNVAHAGNPLLYFSNRGTDGFESSVPAGIHALSNHLLDTPWPKVRRLHARFERELQHEEPRVDELLGFLEDIEPARDDELPSTGLPPDWERRLSAAKIIGNDYGTRASTIVLASNEGECTFIERRYSSNGKIAGETVERFEAQ
ncbi:MAG: NRDE family protein [Proteobacteria bacterium]|nr:NRDE family protein [Pseudomonadota bacterium]